MEKWKDAHHKQKQTAATDYHFSLFLYIAIKMYKALIPLTVKMLEKSIHVTNNSTVYQNITVPAQSVDQIHPRGSAGNSNHRSAQPSLKGV